MKNDKTTSETPAESIPALEAKPVSKMRLYLCISISVITIMLVLGYFAGVPQMHANHQKTHEARHNQINENLIQVYNSLKREVFTTSNLTATRTQADIKASLMATNEATRTLNSNSPVMTDFKAWPLLSWNRDYQTVIKLDAQERRYLNDARAFLAQYNSLLVYMNKSLDIQLEIEKTLVDMKRVNNSNTLEQIAVKLDESAVKLQQLSDQSKAIKAPAFLKEDHENKLALTDKLVTEINKMAVASRRYDLTKLSIAETEITRIAKEAERLDQVTIAKLQNDSAIQKKMEKLRTLNDQVVKYYSQL